MPTTLADRILKARISSGLTQAQLASKAGTQWQQVSRWERGEAEPRAKAQKALSDALGINQDWLRTGEGEMFLPMDLAPGLQAITAAAEMTESHGSNTEINTRLLEKIIHDAIDIAGAQNAHRLANAIATTYGAVCQSKREDRISELLKMFLS